MKITYLGHSCFLFESNSGIKVMIDPYTRVGYELPKGLTANIALTSHGHFDHNYVQAIDGTPIVCDKAGKYNVAGVEIEGFDSWHDPKQGALRGNNVIFHFTLDGVRFCHFGDLGEGYNEKVASKLSGADVWLIPVGGTYTIDALQALEYMDKLSPKVVIPMHYLPADGALDIAPIENFLSKVQTEAVIPCKDGVFTLNKEDLQQLTGKIIYMERRK
ncbi:MAG: MBL fold metallo-hydrolase [Clostridia bacterium]|nr:MBL fold metallo-hydrolase [Clostridia bacterium]